MSKMRGLTEAQKKQKALIKKKAEIRYGRRMEGYAPVSQWDRKVFNDIASDRGYRTQTALAFAVSQELEVSMDTAKRIIASGRMTWGQALVLGALFDMTPKEFADCFMAGYFKEVREGEYRAVLEDKTALLQPPAMYRAD